MKLTILVDNNTIIDRYYKGEPALSFLLELNNKKILFDTGYSDLFLENAKKMNIDLSNIDYLVLSHGHNDHIGGIKYLINILRTKPILIAHPDIFYKKIDEDNSNIGFDDIIIENNFIFKLSKTPVFIDKNLLFLGEIPRNNSFEAKENIGFYTEKGVSKPDYLLDDSALVYKTTDGINIITGCSHSGIINIINYAKSVFNESRVNSLIGGFHLLNENKILINQTIENLKSISPKTVYPCHCTELIAKCELLNNFNVKEIGVGTVLNF